MSPIAARSFSGAFYRRFVLGEWVAAQGRVYDFFDESWARPVPVGGMERWCISCDYGTVNPTSLGLWGLRDGVWYRVAESYYDARAEGRQRTDGEHADALERLAGGRPIWKVVADPSAGGRVQAPFAGIVEPGPRGLPLPGQAVKAGEVLAWLRPSVAPMERSARLAEQADVAARLAAAAIAASFSATVPDSCGPWNMPTVIIYAASTRSFDLRML